MGEGDQGQKVSQSRLQYGTNHLSTAQQSPRKTMMRGSQDLPPELQAQARDQRLVLLKPSRSAYCHQP